MDTQLWRVAYGFQIIPCILSTFLWLCCHRYETPQFIVDKGVVNDDALSYLKKIYKLKDPDGYKKLLNELEEVAKATQDQHPEEG